MKMLARAYFVEAKWLHQGYMPTLEENMKNAVPSSGYPTLTIISFLGMGDIVKKEAFDWALKVPEIVRAASIIARLRNDIVGYKFEQKREHIAKLMPYDATKHNGATSMQ
ncbi:unnamed protein product [Coffea canephora]|uniref:Terpene synthase metal-binding domain-containing protein n=1 Tax=Coffea canephora TaxID=49390 RepID=A0A068UUT0_COFCA|nr:unnamed protein product [Coffea canephora]